LEYQNHESEIITVQDTFLIIDYYWGNLFIPFNEEVQWNVTAFDLHDSSIALNGPFSFEIWETEIVDNNNNLIPDKYILYANYPNPFNPETTIKYGLPEESFVTISIFDINGRQVETLVNQTQAAGYYTISWQASKFVSGIYFYRIVVKNPAKGGAGDFQQVRKCILLK